MREIQTLSDPAGATVSGTGWIVYLADNFNAPRIDITFDTAPTSAGLITVTKVSGAGSAYDSIIRTVNPIGQTDVRIEGLHGFANGDQLKITYPNPDIRDIEATAIIEIPLRAPEFIAGMSVSDGLIRSQASKYRRYFHIDLFSADPASSGAVYEDPTLDYLGGQRLNASTDTLQASWDLHGDWDTAVQPMLEAGATNMVAGTDPADIIKFRFRLYYAQCAVPGVRYQSFTAERTVGLLPQYTLGCFELDLDTDVTDNPMLPGDHIYAMLNLTADSDIDDVIINHASFSYATTHVGVEEEDI